jgi:mevalonate pyrophosphate decarboxylase
MTANDLSKYIVKVFSPTGKKVGATMLRHIVISELFPARLEEQQKTADLMLHSTNQQNLYAKKI